MAITPSVFQQVAKAIQNQGALPAGEVRYRLIAARAYYAAFIATRDAIQRRHTISAEEFVGHLFLCDQLQKHVGAAPHDGAIRDLGIKLNRMRLKRTDADYKLRKAFLEATAEDNVEDADWVLQRLPALEPHLPRVKDPQA